MGKSHCRALKRLPSTPKVKWAAPGYLPTEQRGGWRSKGVFSQRTRSLTRKQPRIEVLETTNRGSSGSRK